MREEKLRNRKANRCNDGEGIASPYAQNSPQQSANDIIYYRRYAKPTLGPSFSDAAPTPASIHLRRTIIQDQPHKLPILIVGGTKVARLSLPQRSGSAVPSGGPARVAPKRKSAITRSDF